MLQGERTELPFWLREIEWRNLTLLPSPFVGGAIDPTRVTAALNTEVVGAVVVSLDNNNTPPHLVRGLMDSIGSILAQALREEIEPNTALVALDSRFQANLQVKLQEIALRTLSAERIAELATQLTLGSTSNPDQLTGIQILIMPAIAGFPRSESTGTLNLPRIVTAGPVSSRSVIQPLQPWAEMLAFQGSGAHYDVRATMARAACQESAMLRTLSIAMLSGDDGLRDESPVQLALELAGSEPMVVPLLSGDGDRRFNQIMRTVTLPRPVRRGDLRRIGLLFPGASPFQDNWTLNAFQVRAGGVTLLNQSGRPLMRFNGEARRWMQDVSCTNPSSPGIPLAADRTIRALEVSVRTGADDLRGGNDNASVFVGLSGGRRIEVSLNQGRRLPDYSSSTAILTLPPGTNLAQIQRLGIQTTLSGGLSGDNWNLDALTVRAIAGDGSMQTILDQSGNPLARLTGYNRERLWSLRR
jgi:hypothetical protein